MLTSSAKDIMTRGVVTIKKGAAIEDAMRLMAEHHVSGLPVVDADGCIEGIITESDVLLKGQTQVKGHSTGFKAQPTVAEDVVQEMYRRASGNTVADAMTRKVITFGEDSAVSDIARVMVEQNINRIPIVRDCKVVGIVSRRDIVKAMARMIDGPQVAHKPKKQRKVIDLT